MAVNAFKHPVHAGREPFHAAGRSSFFCGFFGACFPDRLQYVAVKGLRKGEETNLALARLGVS